MKLRDDEMQNNRIVDTNVVSRTREFSQNGCVCHIVCVARINSKAKLIFNIIKKKVFRSLLYVRLYSIQARTTGMNTELHRTEI